jgi:hypothetical protein
VPKVFDIGRKKKWRFIIIEDARQALVFLDFFDSFTLVTVGYVQGKRTTINRALVEACLAPERCSPLTNLLRSSLFVSFFNPQKVKHDQMRPFSQYFIRF